MNSSGQSESPVAVPYRIATVTHSINPLEQIQRKRVEEKLLSIVAQSRRYLTEIFTNKIRWLTEQELEKKNWIDKQIGGLSEYSHFIVTLDNRAYQA